MTAETRKRDILLTLMISLFAGGLPLSALPVALPSIADALGLTAVQTGGVSVVFALVSAAFILPVGRLADIIGRRRIFATGIAIVATGLAASALAPSWLLLMAALALTGFGTAMSIATGMALLSSAFPAQERGRALGMVTAAVYLGHALGPSIGGLLTHHFG
jgi:MFS family permease